MDKELIRYIFIHNFHLFTEKEIAANKHLTVLLKHGDNEKRKQFGLKASGTDDPEALALLEGGEWAFMQRVAERILRDHKDKVFINNCPKCGKLARTPQAKQCRHCGHDWH